jgi:hypothetical protein
MADVDRILIVGGGIGASPWWRPCTVGATLQSSLNAAQPGRRSGQGSICQRMPCGSCWRWASGRLSIGMPQCSAAGDSLISKGNCSARPISKSFGAM